MIRKCGKYSNVQKIEEILFISIYIDKIVLIFFFPDISLILEITLFHSPDFARGDFVVKTNSSPTPIPPSASSFKRPEGYYTGASLVAQW